MAIIQGTKGYEIAVAGIGAALLIGDAGVALFIGTSRAHVGHTSGPAPGRSPWDDEKDPAPGDPRWDAITGDAVHRMSGIRWTIARRESGAGVF